MNDELWVDARLKALDCDSQWRPDGAPAFAGLLRRESRRLIWRRRWAWSSAGMAALFMILLALPQGATCAIAGVGCPHSVAPVPAAAVRSAPKPESAKKRNYKESGASTAPVVCEIYSDFECPHCAVFFNSILPLLISDYVKTGKVRIVYRDFPLPQHTHAMLAARYANAAGELGRYDAAAAELFNRQKEWSAGGDIAASLRPVLGEPLLSRIRLLAEKDSAALDASVAADQTAGAREGVTGTPAVVFIANGAHRTVTGIQNYEILRRYIDELLTNNRTE